jgi:hypothetical protein
MSGVSFFQGEDGKRLRNNLLISLGAVLTLSIVITALDKEADFAMS